MKRDRVAKKEYVGECAGNCLVDKQRKRWIDTEGMFKENGFGYQASVGFG